jgi:diphthamide biosynthesis enzyme Dph1/Dph2-like protein
VLLEPGRAPIIGKDAIKAYMESQAEISRTYRITKYEQDWREITPESLMEFPSIDAYVNTACPRVSLDAPEKFLKPVITINLFLGSSKSMFFRLCSRAPLTMI